MVRVKGAGRCIRVRKCSHERSPLAATREHNRTAVVLANGQQQIREKDNVETQRTPSRAEGQPASVKSFCGREGRLAQVVEVFQDG